MKKIAITTRVDVIESIDERRDALSQEWSFLFNACEFIPIIMPNNLDTVKGVLSNITIDGILLTGGNDIAEYGGDAAERDGVESYLIEYAISKNIPLLGVCRGMQILLHSFDVPLKKINNHVRIQHTLISSHRSVNSYHNWGTDDCGSEFMVLDKSEDAIIEAVKHKDYNLQGIMWHPERVQPFCSMDIQYLKEVFK